MALTVAELAFLFSADDKEVRAALANMRTGAGTTATAMDKSMGGFWRDEGVRTRSQAQMYAKAGSDAGGKFKSHFGAAVRDVGAPLAAAFGGAELARFIGESIHAASDLNEEVSKSKVIFGDSADAIFAWAKDTKQNLLLTQTQAIQAAGTFGIFGKSAGLTGSNLSDFSNKLVGLSQDFSSFYNASPAEAIEAIGAALRGESEPIRRFGVLLSDQVLRQKAYELGIISTTKNALTPQQRVIAAYNVILEQSKVAQGDAARTQSGFANSTRKLQQEVANLQVALGKELLPTAVKFVHFLTEDGVPALMATGHAVGEVTGLFNGLPAPVKAATVALIALRLASNFGWMESAGNGARKFGGVIDSLRLRTMLATDEFKASRAGVMQFTGNIGKIEAPVGRAKASMSSLRAATIGMGAGMKAGLSNVVGFLGGPWGIALTAATVGITYFWQQHQKAKAEVADFSATLDEETGALTENSRQWVAKKLLDAGVLTDAEKLGISLSKVTDAALGQAGALDQLNAQLYEIQQNGTSTTGQGQFMSDAARSAEALRGSLNDTNGVVQQSRAESDLLTQAIGGQSAASADAAAANDDNAGSLSDYAAKADAARTAIQKLADAENKRRLAQLKDRQDRLALIETLQATKKEATNSDEVAGIRSQISDAHTSGASERSGLRDQLKDAKTAKERARINGEIAASTKQEADEVAKLTKALREYDQTLNPHTKAGQENLNQLYSLADQWGNTSTKVQNAKGMYEKVRAEFIADAIAMGDTKEKARKLADQLLLVPKGAPIRFQSDSVQQAYERVKKLKALLDAMKFTQGMGVDVSVGGKHYGRYAQGGVLKGVGGPRGDQTMFLGSPGETITPNGPSQKYAGLLEAIRNDNAARIQALAGGATVDYDRLGGAVAAAMGGRVAPVMHVETMRVADMREAEQHARQNERLASVGGVSF